METVLPICTEEWQTVQREHALWLEKNRTKESLKKKFQQLYRNKVIALDSNYPSEVIRVKQLYYGPLTQKTELFDGEAEDDDYVDATYDQDSPTQDGQTAVVDDNDPGKADN